MVLLCDLSQVEGRIDPVGDNVNLDARSVHGLCWMYHRVRNHFGCTRWYTYVTWIKLKLISVHLETVLMSTQDRCTVCAECVIGLEIISDAPDGTPTVHGSSGGSFGSIWRYCKSRHKIAAQFLGAPDDSPSWLASRGSSFRLVWW
jgi:hypothetical protein